MKSRSYYSVPSNKTKKTISGKKGKGRPLTIEEANKQSLQIQETKRKKRERIRKELGKRKKNTPYRMFLSEVAKLADYAYKNPSKESIIIKKLNETFPDYSDLDYVKAFATYSELVQGKKITYTIDNQLLKAFLTFIVRHKTINDIQRSVVSLESFCKTHNCTPELRGYLRMTARKHHVFISI